MSGQRQKVTDHAIALTIGVASLAVTVPRAFAYPFWQDEVGAARVIVSPGLVDALRKVVSSENHPPGFYAFGWALHGIGIPVVWDRAISVLATAVLAGCTVLYARRVLPITSAALAGLVVVLGWQLGRHGWELRPYALFALLAFGVIYALERAAFEPTLRNRALLAGVVAIGGLVHYFTLFTIAAGLLWLSLTTSARGRKGAVVAIGLGLLPFAAWIPAFVRQYQHGRFSTLPGFNIRGVVDLNAELLERSVPRSTTGLLFALAVLAVTLFGAVRLWRDPGRGRLCALAAVVPVGLAAGIWLIGPHIFAPRALIGIAPFAAIAIGAAVTVSSKPLALVMTAGVAGLLLFGFVTTYGRITPPYDRVATALVDEGWQPRDPIVLFGPLYQYLHPLDWYLPGPDPLQVATTTGQPCKRLFIVAVGGQARALTAPLGAEARHVGSIVIGSLPWRAVRWSDVRQRHGNIIGTSRSGCIRAVKPI